MAIGGRTVEELKDEMTYEEFQTWETYRERRGTLHHGVRLEWLFARLSLQVAQALGAKDAKFTDLLRYHDTDQPEAVEANSFQDVAILMGARRGK